MFVNSMHSFMFDSSITCTMKPFQFNSTQLDYSYSIFYMLLGVITFYNCIFYPIFIENFYVSSIAVRYGIKDGKNHIISTLKLFQSGGETDMKTNITSC